jgi:cytochrome c553
VGSFGGPTGVARAHARAVASWLCDAGFRRVCLCRGPPEGGAILPIQFSRASQRSRARPCAGYEGRFLPQFGESVPTAHWDVAHDSSRVTTIAAAAADFCAQANTLFRSHLQREDTAKRRRAPESLCTWRSTRRCATEFLTARKMVTRDGADHVRGRADTTQTYRWQPYRVLTRDIRDGHNAIDWFPEDHPNLPAVVAHGPAALGARGRGCGFCHLSNGRGRQENAPVTGLPVAYFTRQIEEFRSGRRRSADPMKANTNTMIDLAKALTRDEAKPPPSTLGPCPIHHGSGSSRGPLRPGPGSSATCSCLRARRRRNRSQGAS